MKKFVLAICLIALICCSKKDITVEQNEVEVQLQKVQILKKESAIDSLILSDEFGDFADVYFDNTIKRMSLLKSKGLSSTAISNEFDSLKTLNEIINFSITYSLDTTVVKDMYIDPLSALTLFLKYNPKYENYTDVEINDLVKSALNKVASDPSFHINNPTNKLGNSINDFILELNGQFDAQITWEEALGCVAIGLAAYVAENWKSIKTLASVLKGEFPTFGVIKAAVTLFFPQTKVVWAATSLVGCLINAYFVD